MKLRPLHLCLALLFSSAIPSQSFAGNVNAANVVSVGNAADEKESAAVRAEYIRKNYTKFEYRIPARDGKLLFTSVYVPNDASATKRYPILFVRTPYTVAPYGAEKYKT